MFKSFARGLSYHVGAGIGEGIRTIIATTVTTGAAVAVAALAKKLNEKNAVDFKRVRTESDKARLRNDITKHLNDILDRS